MIISWRFDYYKVEITKLYVSLNTNIDETIAKDMFILLYTSNPDTLSCKGSREDFKPLKAELDFIHSQHGVQTFYLNPLMQHDDKFQ